MNDQIMTVEEVATFLKVSQRTVYDWAQNGEIPCGKLGTSWRFKRDEIENWVSRKLTPRIRSDESHTMTLSSIFSPERSLVLEETRKQAVLNRLVDVSVELPGVRNRAELAEAVYNREKLMSTGIGLGIAVPHVRLPEVKEVMASAAVCKHPITDYESLDNTPVQIVILIIAGRNQHAEYIQVLSSVASMLKQEHVRENLLGCSEPSDIYEILGERHV
ncbi:MAG: PTS sugar transporter subunit IIA [candidate division KSB1 bacterium]|nr:PTS sugar transporter subunit IIA [candidate division KSB1 bacterium]